MEIDWLTFIAEIINLFVLVWLLKHFLYHPITNIIEQRRKEINEKVDSAEALHKQAESEFQTLEIEKNAFEKSQQDQQNKLAKDLKQYRDDTFGSIKKDAQVLKRQLTEEILSQREILKSELERFISSDFISVAGKIITELTNATPIERVLNLFYDRLLQLSKSEITKINKIVKNQKVITINSSIELTEKHRQDMNKFLKSYFNLHPKIKIQYHVVPELILGVEIRIQDMSVDWTLKNYLDELQQGLDQALRNKGENKC